MKRVTYVLLRVVFQTQEREVYMEELKARSFRITDETANKIKELANEIEGNQQEVIAKLIETYEFQKGKTILNYKKDDIEKFEQYTSILVRMFMSSLEENQTITETVHTEFESQLNSKDIIIQSLQEENRTLKQEKNSVAEESKIMIEENQRLQQQLKQVQEEAEEKKASYESIIKDKEGLNQILVSSTNDLKNQVEEIKNKLIVAEKETKQYQELNTQFQTLSQNKKELESQLEELKKENEEVILRMKEDNKKNLEHVIQKSELEQEKRILEYKKIHQEEIDQYQKKYFDLLEKLQKQEQQTIKTNLNKQTEENNA